MATLHFVYGKPGAGKTRLARELAETTPALLFCGDEWLLTLTNPIKNLEQYVAASRRVRAMIGPMAARILRLGTFGSLRSHPARARRTRRGVPAARS
jgi:predicted kinase